ncbi:hypothetical protein [Macrococcoides caseolyticum]|uniref:hypothetical protein n=1 Tax=Macrococcoides caseolyticum TaxID=69966 RepID=UPI001F356BD6|nr:hypothetical protein [Macrococcus caseolyticus]MCE4958081.1 hypothetical protein [Macrococcus caseolyticus]
MNRAPINDYIKTHDSKILPNFARLLITTNPNKKLSIVGQCIEKYSDNHYFGYHPKINPEFLKLYYDGSNVNGGYKM